MRRALGAVLVVALVTATVGSGALTSQRTLVVEDTVTGETYLTAPVTNGTVVALEYTHSVEQTRVYDEYTVRGDRLVMTRMEFASYGWGLPASANVTRENGTFVFDPEGAYTRLTVTPGPVAGHTLIVGQTRYDLVAMSDERAVDFHLTRRSALTAATDSL